MPAMLHDEHRDGTKEAEVAVVLPNAKRRRGGWARISSYGLLMVLALMSLLLCVLLPNTFATFGNFQAMIVAQAVLLFLALAVTVPLRIGAFDLSVAANMIFTACLIAVLTTEHGWNTWAAVLVGLIASTLIGLINAYVIVTLGVNAFIVTLGVMTALQGLGFAITDSRVIFGLPEPLLNVSRSELWGIPSIAYIGWALAAVVWYVYEYTPFGRHLLFVGGNIEAAKLSGVPVAWVRYRAFLMAGLFSGMAGVLLLGLQGAVDPSVAPQYLLAPYAAAFLGTTAIQPGRFNVVGTLVGLYLLIVGVTGLQLMGAATWVSQVFNGVALVTAVIFAHLGQKKSGKVT